MEFEPEADRGVPGLSIQSVDRIDRRYRLVVTRKTAIIVRLGTPPVAPPGCVLHPQSIVAQVRYLPDALLRITGSLPVRPSPILVPRRDDRCRRGLVLRRPFALWHLRSDSREPVVPTHLRWSMPNRRLRSLLCPRPPRRVSGQTGRAHRTDPRLRRVRQQPQPTLLDRRSLDTRLIPTRPYSRRIWLTRTTGPDRE